MRLTEKDYCGYDIKDRKNFNGYNEQEDCEKLFSALQKLGQLEDTEEELNVDLITLFKTKTVWCKALVENKQTKERCYQIIERNLWGINLEDKKIMVGSPYKFAEYPLNEKGKTWALTKEELL